MDLNLSNKHALVCGSTQGIGRAVAVELAGLGATVTLLARHAGRLKTVQATLPVPEKQSHAYEAADFSNPEQVREAAERVNKRSPVHILVNNTGGPPGGPLMEATPKAFLQAFQQHLICNHLLTRAVVPAMKQAGYGRIINIISTSVKQPIQGLGVSNTVRGAVASWSKTLSMELGTAGITVNNVLPGYTQTGRLDSLLEKCAQKEKSTVARVAGLMQQKVPLGRFGKPEEVAAMAAYLATPAAAYVNGVSIQVDGGRVGNLA